MKNRMFRIGAVIGAMLGTLIAVGMDYMSGDIPGGGWVGAVAHDLSLSSDSPGAVIIALFCVLIMVVISAGMGGLCGLMLDRFFKIFTQE
ncbi:MAG TPA: hypothetical protein VMB78_12070 [Dissulfurispiraceae bacterium]|nr:hypothetical protein [Dissulfurispiraceae bacterium]